MLANLKQLELLRSLRVCAAAVTAFFATVALLMPAIAKSPGHTYCFYGKCHRVKTLAEMQELVGTQSVMTASHYDSCKRDRYNPCGLTSSGEQFYPDQPDNAASPIYPDGTTLLVRSPESQEAIVLRVNNAGPYWGDRTLDVSRAAAERLGFNKRGIGKLEVRVLSAPTREDAGYRRDRKYEPVLGHIGRFENIEEAHKATVTLAAFQAIASSVLAPVGGSSLVTARHVEAVTQIAIADAANALKSKTTPEPTKIAALKPSGVNPAVSKPEDKAIAAAPGAKVAALDVDKLAKWPVVAESPKSPAAIPARKPKPVLADPAPAPVPEIVIAALEDKRLQSLSRSAANALATSVVAVPRKVAKSARADRTTTRQASRKASKSVRVAARVQTTRSKAARAKSNDLLASIVAVPESMMSSFAPHTSSFKPPKTKVAALRRPALKKSQPEEFAKLLKSGKPGRLAKRPGGYNKSAGVYNPAVSLRRQDWVQSKIV